MAPTSANGIAAEIGRDHVDGVLDRLNKADFTECQVPEIKEALVVLVQGMSVLIKRHEATRPKGWQDIVLAIGVKAPWAAALCFVAYVFGKVHGAI